MENKSKVKLPPSRAAHKKYAVITYEKRVELIMKIQNGSKIATATKQLGIKQSTGLLINNNYNKYGKIFNKFTPIQTPNGNHLSLRVQPQKKSEKKINLSVPPQPEIKKEENNAEEPYIQVPASFNEGEPSPDRSNIEADDSIFPNYNCQMSYYVQPQMQVQQFSNPYMLSYWVPQYFYYG